MQMDLSEERPIFVQIAEGIEDAVLSGAFPEESQIPSITEFSVMYKINPATALKGINLLVEQDILYKKRGVGMFVKSGAFMSLKKKRKEHFYQNYIEGMIAEAKRLTLSEEEIKTMIERGYRI